ncbi:MAG: HEAT repeat domain-containing protein, partial [Spirochaetota bacterium]
YGNIKHCAGLIEYISRYIDKTDYMEYICKAVYTLGQIGSGDSAAEKYIEDIITNPEMFEKLRSSAIESFTSGGNIAVLEELLRENNDRISYAVYRALSGIADREMIKYEGTAGDDLFTVMPGQEDRTLLDIRVLLGKMSPQFDAYSRETKAAYIMAMILCGHREFIVYTMKALTSNDTALIDLTLYVILSYAEKLRTPDKLFRSLIALPSVTSRDSGIIIDIFVKYFSQTRETKSNQLFKDKIFNYIVVTLDSYFETYRKNFMIPEIMEKDHTKETQGIRKFVINMLSPELKRKVLGYLKHEDPSLIKKILGEISESVSFIPENEKENFAHFIEMLCERDLKSREISSARIEDIDYEKRYLRNRVVRLCHIIGRLNIAEASANLVKMFNYVKKYYDEDIYDAVTYTLSLLNYPYMLSELEVLLSSGDDAEKVRGVRLLALFSEQRSLNIMLDYVSEYASDTSQLMEDIVSILSKRDVRNNLSAGEAAKKIIESNKKPEIKRFAIHLLGQCGVESDFQYLINLFPSLTENISKEAVVQAFDFIMQKNEDFNKNIVIGQLREFLKDPAIKVRIYACSILLRQGNQDALGTIRDMMIIKNRNIQREIITVLGNYVPLDLAFFLLSLLKEDYAISQDIVPLFRYLQPSDQKEIDHFIVNLFKKYEGAGSDYAASAKGGSEIKNHKKENVTMLIIEILNYDNLYTLFTPVEISMIFKNLYAQILDIITQRNGSLTRTSAGNIIAFFPEVVSATGAASVIGKILSDFNIWLLPENQVRMVLYLTFAEADIVNGEIILPVMREFTILRGAPLENKVFLGGDTAQIAELSFRCETLPASLFRMNGVPLEFRELVSNNNFMTVAESVLGQLKEAEDKRLEVQRQLELGIKTDGSQNRSKNTLAFSGAMEKIGKILRKDLYDVSRYVSKRSTDKEMIRTVDKMLDDAYRRYMLETSKTTFD